MYIPLSQLGRVEVHLHSFLTSTLDGDNESSVFIFKRQIVTVLAVLDPDDIGTKIVRNGADYCLNDIPEGLDLQQHPLCEPQTSQQYTLCVTFLIKRFSPAPCHFLPLRHKYLSSSALRSQTPAYVRRHTQTTGEEKTSRYER